MTTFNTFMYAQNVMWITLYTITTLDPKRGIRNTLGRTSAPSVFFTWGEISCFGEIPIGINLSCSANVEASDLWHFAVIIELMWSDTFVAVHLCSLKKLVEWCGRTQCFLSFFLLGNKSLVDQNNYSLLLMTKWWISVWFARCHLGRWYFTACHLLF